MAEPAREYARRLEDRRAESARLETRHIQAGNVRLALFAAGAALAWYALPWATLPAVLFVPLAVYHERVIGARRRARRAEAVYERGIARIEDRWAGGGERGDRFRDAAHPYSEDLDLFGAGSLFELLSIARTRMGESTLAAWLLQPSPADLLRERQHAVAGLRERLDFREDIAVLGEDVRVGVHPEALRAWAEAPTALGARSLRAAAAALSLAAASGAAWWAWSGTRLPFELALTLVAGFGLWLRARVLAVLRAVEPAAHDLALLASVLERIEREPEGARLRAHGWPASRQIARLNRLVEWIDSRDNWLLRLVGPPLLYGTHLAFATEAWRSVSGKRVNEWLSLVGEIEALSSLACYAYEHPGDSFPEFLEGPATLEAAGLGHPLLAAARTVRNDVRLTGGRRLLLVSGSNMSGKSTLLRSVGVNTVLAMAGSPVRAHSLRLTPLAIGAAIRVTDSLQGGTSRFYAEITRLRRVLDLAAGQVPALFLLDELLNGTNSSDRRIGAEGIVQELLGRGAIGLVTTHDLALAQIAEALRPAAENVHFEDRLEGGALSFDYTLRAGVVRRSNALELMRAIGIYAGPATQSES